MTYAVFTTQNFSMKYSAVYELQLIFSLGKKHKKCPITPNSKLQLAGITSYFVPFSSC